jgi:GTP-binding protein EngB required for normal cell division
MGAEGALGARVAALGRAVELGRPHLPEAALRPAAEVVAKAGERLRHGTAHTVVALAGPTGSGKSSLFNALVGADLSSVGVRRPTTGETHAAVWGADAGPLLDWLQVRRRHVVEGGAPGLQGLVLLDLPDFDSTAVAHQLEVSRLVPLVDLLVWLVEPQKYADQSLHEGVLRPLAEYGGVMRFVLTKADLLAPGEASACAADLADHLVDDGIDAPEVLLVSVADGEGLGSLTKVLEEEVVDRQAAVARLELDVAAAAGPLLGGAGAEDGVPAGAVRDLVASLGRAAGIDVVAAAAARQYRRDAVAAVGWPPVRWVSKLRRSPLAGLPAVERSPMASTGVSSALRRIGESAGDGLAAPWDEVVRARAMGRRDDVLRTLGRVTAGGVRRPRPPRWWSVGRWLQRVVTVLAVVGLVWLVALALVESLLRLDADPLAPVVGEVPVPTALLLGGALLGLVVAGLGRLLARVGARRRARGVTRHLRRDVERVAEECVVGPVEEVLADRRAFVQAVRGALDA